jgi:hypothetical protein
MLLRERDSIGALIAPRQAERLAKLGPRRGRPLAGLVADGEIQDGAAGRIERVARPEFLAGFLDSPRRKELAPSQEELRRERAVRRVVRLANRASARRSSSRGSRPRPAGPCNRG